MDGRLIVIEGLDGSGKSTQLEILKSRLSGRHELRFVKFPNYDDPSSTLIKMYLNGEFGGRPDDVNAYAASTFYAVDRYAGYKRHWGADYHAGKIILCDRYVTSNAVHQASKLPCGEWVHYLDWLYDLEFDKIGIPKPDAVIYLDVPVEISQKLMSERYCGDENKKDIHERDTAYLEHCREAALFAAEHLGWTVIHCSESGKMRAVEDIADEIFTAVGRIL